MDQSPLKSKSVEFDIFGYIHKTRQTYGIRAQDYMRYRRYCAHHLRNVRKATRLSQGSSTSYKPIVVTAEMVSEARHIEILVLQTERAWAFAMDLRELHSRTEEPRQHYHLVRRLKAACKAGRYLADVAHAVCDLQTALAASAYWLQMQSQLRFELEEWEAAMDSAVFSRVISEQLAVSGSSERYALCHAMIEELDPIVRLAAYQTGMNETNRSSALIPALASQWFESRMKSNASRVEKHIPGYALITTSLETLMTDTSSEDTRGELVDAANANKLVWRGGVVVFTNKDIASLLKTAQGAVRDCSGSGDTQQSLVAVAAADPARLEPVISSFRRVRKAARQCYADGVSAAAKVGSSASDKLLSPYVAIQLYSTCMLHAALAAKSIGRAQALASNNDMALDDLAPAFSKTSEPWMEDHTRSFGVGAKSMKGKAIRTTNTAGKKGKRARTLPEPTEIVILYDMAGKSMGRLKNTVGELLNRISPAVGRTVQAYSLIEEISAAEAYYACVRGYYAAALHAHAPHKKYVDALALLDHALNESIPKAQKLALAVSESESESTAAAWEQTFVVTSSDLSQVKARLEAATENVRGLCAAAPKKGIAASRRQAARKSWYAEPGARPRMVPNAMTGSASGKSKASLPACIPNLVDLSNPAFGVVPMKPLFYDLAAPSIDFNMDTIEEKAGKQTASSGSKLGSIIGSLWSTR
ncbi:signal recognition particle subunit srp68 [Coemansia sp. Benny D160-2]|nr:signal recognition particle subunit srp68 [Coemansia sp. Benny D160-2]